MNVPAGSGGRVGLGSAALQPQPPYRLEFCQGSDGSTPVRDWIRKDLTRSQRRQLGVAMRSVLQRLGIEVCGTRFGKALGGGLFEFRLSITSPDAALLRIFCHAHGNRVILLLSAYDKGRDPKSGRQQREIAVARQRLADFRTRQRNVS
jgi:hypothetical protein